jgi:hypothetical protein
MGISLFIGAEEDSEIRLTNAYWYNEFLNYIAERGDCDNLMYFTPGISRASIKHKGDRLDDIFSVEELTREVNRIILDKDSPDYAKYIALKYLQALEECERQKLPLYID